VWRGAVHSSGVWLGPPPPPLGRLLDDVSDGRDGVSHRRRAHGDRAALAERGCQQPPAPVWARAQVQATGLLSGVGAADVARRNGERRRRLPRGVQVGDVVQLVHLRGDVGRCGEMWGDMLEISSRYGEIARWGMRRGEGAGDMGRYGR